AQSSYAPLNPDYYHRIDRYEIKAGRTSGLFTNIKPYRRSAIAAFVDSVDNRPLFTSRSDQFNRDYLLTDNHEWLPHAVGVSKRPVLKHFYKRKSDLYHVATP